MMFMMAEPRDLSVDVYRLERKKKNPPKILSDNGRRESVAGQGRDGRQDIGARVEKPC